MRDEVKKTPLLGDDLKRMLSRKRKSRRSGEIKSVELVLRVLQSDVMLNNCPEDNTGRRDLRRAKDLGKTFSSTIP